MKRKIAAILAADVAGFSRLVAEDEEETLRRLASYRQVFDDFVQRYGGRIFNTAGDSVMCAFESAVEAVRAAIDIQESLRTRNLAYPASRRMQFRIGITIGDVVERDGDLLGDGVNIAARLESLADPGGICISRSVHEAVANKIAVRFRELGPREVKNLPQPVHAFVVAWPASSAVADAVPPQRRDAADDDDDDSEADARAARRRRRRSRAFIYPLVVLAVIIVGLPLLKRMKRVIDGGPPPITSAERPKPPDDPAEAYAALVKSGSLVADAKTAPELYHNARLLEARGAALNARRTYLEYANLGAEFVDPHLRFSALVRVQDGRAGAREVYGSLLAAHPAKIVALMHALQFDGSERRAKIEAFVNDNPDFAPASYVLAEEHSEEKLGVQTLTDRRLEFEAFERFLEAQADGRLNPFFLDHSVLDEWVDKAKRRKSAIEAFFQTAPTRPTADFTRSNDGWKVTLIMPEPATEISYRLGESGDFQSTGLATTLDRRTSKPAAVPSFQLPADQGKEAIYVAYKDANGNDAGPFAINFDPVVALAESGRAILEVTTSIWVSFRNEGEGALAFHHLISYRCAIKKAEVGFDGGPLDSTLPLPPCDPANPYVFPADARPYASIPAGIKSVSLRLTYADGSQSEIKTFKRE